MLLIKALWADECGLILSSELVLIGTMGVLGATVGLNMAATSVNEEFKDFAFAIRSLDQSYSVQGFSSARASTAGSHFQQQDVATSLEELVSIAAEQEADQISDEAVEEQYAADPEA